MRLTVTGTQTKVAALDANNFPGDTVDGEKIVLYD